MKKIRQNCAYRITSRLDLVGYVALGTIILCVSFPELILSSNYSDIPRGVEYFRVALVVALGIFMAISVLVIILPMGLARVLGVMVATYGVIALISDYFWPLGIGPIEHGDEVAQVHVIGGFVQLVLLGLLFMVLYSLPSRAGSAVGWSMGTILLLFALPFAGQNANKMGTAGDVGEATPEFNVYHIVFDSYYGPWLPWSMGKLGITEESLGGFLHYPNAFSNYWATRSSYSSFMSGTLYVESMRVSEWLDSANRSSIVDDMHSRGFESWSYALNDNPGIVQVKNKVARDPDEWQVVSPSLALDYILLRIAPVISRARVMGSSGRGPVTRWKSAAVEQPQGDVRTYVSYRQFERFLEEEQFRPSKGQYVHLYLYPPHGPHQLNREGEFVGQSDYVEQLHLATNMLYRIVNRLVELDRYDAAVIVVHSDHGSTAGGRFDEFESDMQNAISVNRDIARRISDVDVRGRGGVAIEARYRSLLMIKRCGVGMHGELESDGSLVQLLDLRDWLVSLMDDPDCNAKYPEHSDIVIQHGLVTQLDEAGNRLKVGGDILSGRINRYKVRLDGEWEILEDLFFEY